MILHTVIIEDWSHSYTLLLQRNSTWFSLSGFVMVFIKCKILILKYLVDYPKLYIYTHFYIAYIQWSVHELPAVSFC